MPVINKIHRPKKYTEVKGLGEKCLREGSLLVSLAKAKNPEAKKIKDFLLGMTFARKGMAFQYKKHLLFVLKAKFDPKDIKGLASFLTGR